MVLRGLKETVQGKFHDDFRVISKQFKKVSVDVSLEVQEVSGDFRGLLSGSQMS